MGVKSNTNLELQILKLTFSNDNMVLIWYNIYAMPEPSLSEKEKLIADQIIPDVRGMTVTNLVEKYISLKINVCPSTKTSYNHKLGAIAFQPLPFLRAAHAHVSDGLPAKPVLANPRLHIRKPPSGKKRDEQHPALVIKADAVCFRWHSLFDAFLHGTVYCPPELRNAWVGIPPCRHKRLQLFLRNPHLQCAHGFQCPD